MTPARFLALWQSSESVAEFARRSGYTVGSARVIASRLRAQGVPVPPMRTARPRLRVGQRVTVGSEQGVVACSDGEASEVVIVVGDAVYTASRRGRIDGGMVAEVAS